MVIVVGIVQSPDGLEEESHVGFQERVLGRWHAGVKVWSHA